jgi:hypothetical protein
VGDGSLLCPSDVGDEAPLRAFFRVVLACGALCCAGAAVGSAARADTVTFTAPGEQPPFTVPAGVSSLHVVAIGGRGGTGAGMGGFGATVTADLAVTPGQVLYIEVAGNGGDVDTSANTPGTGGVNGGGAGAAGGAGAGAGGGGESDIRGLPRATDSSLASRLITAAGGGGGGGGAGGSGGGAAGADGAGTGGGKAGTAATGGAAGGGSATAGTFGAGGNGGNATGGTSAGGGGGGGVYGGGGGNGGAGGGGGGMTSPGFGGGGGSTGFGTGVTGASSGLDTNGVASVTLSYVPPAPPPPDTVAPKVSFLVLSPSAFVAANSGPAAVAAASVGTRVLYKLSEPALVTFTAERPTRGIKRGRKCVKRPRRPPRHARPCARYVAVRGSFAQNGAAGLNGLRFMGRLKGRSLPRGNYRLVVSAVDAAGNRSTPVRRPFRIVRG